MGSNRTKITLSEFDKHLHEFMNNNKYLSFNILNERSKMFADIKRRFKDTFGYDIEFSFASPWGVYPGEDVYFVWEEIEN